jgi:hypothetical protein
LLDRRRAEDPDLAQIYRTTFPPPPDYSQRPVALPVNNQDLDLFLHRERWIEHMDPMTAEQIQALVDLPDENGHPYLRQLREHVLHYGTAIQEYIKAHHSLGLMTTMAQVGR